LSINLLATVHPGTQPALGRSTLRNSFRVMVDGMMTSFKSRFFGLTLSKLYRRGGAREPQT